MTNLALTALCDELTNQPGKKLLVADEHLDSNLLLTLKGLVQFYLLTNRFDIYQSALDNGIECFFNDMDLSVCDKDFDIIAYRISKEKAIVHHLINQAPDHLTAGGHFVFCGHKNEGMKTYLSKAESFFGSKAEVSKGQRQLKIASLQPGILNQPLDDKAYEETVLIGQAHGLDLYSKPGQYGWNKIDQGSELLAKIVAAFIHDRAAAPATLLDLGCGYGYLSVCAWHFGIPYIVATDNNAAALTSCRYNFSHNGINGEVITADCATSIHHQFDLVICNPPFHKGFDTEKSLTETFVKSASLHLKNSGTAFFVVNQFIPIEQIAVPYFQSVEVVHQDASFKVIRLSS